MFTSINANTKFQTDLKSALIFSMCLDICMQTYIQRNIHFHIPTYPHAHAHTQSSHSHTYVFSYKHTYKHTFFTYLHIHTHTHTHTEFSFSYRCIIIHKHTYTQPQPDVDSALICVDFPEKRPVLGINECHLRTVRTLTQTFFVSMSPKRCQCSA
jgi:hypothetical protein